MDILKTHEDPAPYLRGVVRTVRSDDGLELWRLSERQVAFHDARSEAAGVRARCQAGQQLALETDSRLLRLAVTVGVGARDYLGIDIEIDGGVRHAVLVRPVGPGPLEFSLFDEGRDAPGRMREIRVHLPQVRQMKLRAVELEDGSEARPLKRPSRRLLCLGDSITQGMSADHPSNIHSVQLARLLDAELLNQGIGGDVFDAGSLDGAPPFAADVITVAFGVNDWNRGTTREAVRANVADYLSALRRAWPQARVVVSSPLWAAPAATVKPGGTLMGFGAAIRDAAGVFAGVEVVDGFQLVPNEAACFVDGVHPNDTGFLHYALGLARTIGRG